MAQVEWNIGWRLKDYKNAVTTQTDYLKTSTGLLADMLLYAAALAPILDAVTESQIVAAEIRIPLNVADYSGLKSAPVTGADNEDAALFDYNTTSVRAYGQSMPALIAGAFNTTQPKFVDLSNAAVAAWSAAAITGTNNTIGTDRYFNNLTALVSGINAFRKHRGAVRRAK